MPIETEAPPSAPSPPSGPSGPSVADRILPPATEPILSDREMGQYAAALVRARHPIAAFVAGSVAVAVLLALVLPKAYTAKTVLLPTDDGEGGIASELGSLASTFGLQFGFGRASQSDLYPTILTSDKILAAVLEDEFVAAEGKAPRKLADLLVKREDLGEYEHRARALRKLRKEVVRAHKDTETGVVSLQVTTQRATTLRPRARPASSPCRSRRTPPGSPPTWRIGS